MLPHVSLAELVPDLPVNLRESNSGVDGNMAVRDLEAICRLVRHHDPRVLFEIGTFDGRTTLNLAAHTHPETRVYTLDLPRSGKETSALPLVTHDRKYIDKPESGTRFQGTDVAHKIVQLHGDSATFDFRPYRRSVDFVLVDGSHSYHYVLNDSYAALEMIRGPGLILWHDYIPSTRACWPGVVRALKSCTRLTPHLPVFATLPQPDSPCFAYLPIAPVGFGKQQRDGSVVGVIPCFGTADAAPD